MTLRPSPALTQAEIKSGLSYATKDGVFTEAMVALTGGTFLTAMAMKMGASNFQIGLLAALPTLSNILQLLSIWLVHRFNNRRAISVICSIIARFPLLVIGILPFIVSAKTSVNALIFLLFFHYAFGSIVGASWNSWMKDLVPGQMLGKYFSHRTRLMQIINVVLSIATALSIDLIKEKYPQFEYAAYPLMFLGGGVLGMIAVWMMGKIPEPYSTTDSVGIFTMIRKPFRDKNFRRLMLFHSAWTFSLNLATPFFAVYLLQSLNIGLSTIIILSILGQLSSIAFVKVWGRYSDVFSNKTVIRICAPIYISCIAGWSFVGNHQLTIPLLVIIHIVSGATVAGINLSLNNIGLKLAGKTDAIAYIAARNVVTAFIPALAPIFAGVMVDFLSSNSFISEFPLNINVGDTSIFRMTSWTVFFIFSAILALASLKFLKNVHEDGERHRQEATSSLVRSMRTRVSWKLLQGTMIGKVVPILIRKYQNRA